MGGGACILLIISSWVWDCKIESVSYQKQIRWHVTTNMCPFLTCACSNTNRALSFIEDYIQNEVLPEYGNTHTTTSVTSLQTTLFRHEARWGLSFNFDIWIITCKTTDLKVCALRIRIRSIILIIINKINIILLLIMWYLIYFIYF